MLYDRKSRYSFSQSSVFQCPRADATGAAPHHYCPLSAHINQKHLVHDVLEQPSRLSPVSFSVSGECSTGTNWGFAGEKEKERQSMVKHIWKTLSRKDKAGPETARLHRHAPECLHRELSISATQRFQTEPIPFPSVEEWVKPVSFSWAFSVLLFDSGLHCTLLCCHAGSRLQDLLSSRGYPVLVSVFNGTGSLQHLSLWKYSAVLKITIVRGIQVGADLVQMGPLL